MLSQIPETTHYTLDIKHGVHFYAALDPLMFSVLFVQAASFAFQA
jgi:hypothetical protein